MSSISDAVFSAGGLASGLDTNSIIDQLVKLESAPLNQLRARQTGVQTQISALADIVSKLSSLGTAASDLGTNGVVGTTAASANDAFTAVPGTDAVAGRYSVEVVQLARASKWRSVPFAAGASHPGGTLQLTVQGKTYDPITVKDGATLADVASAIRAQGAPVSAVVLNDGTSSYLSITATDTGLPSGGGAALRVDFAPDVAPAPGDPPAYAETQAAQNAIVKVDGLSFSRSSNTVGDVIPGTTLTLRKGGAPAEDLVLATDPDATQARLQKFVDAYNGVMKLVQRQLNPTKDTDRGSSLVGDASVRTLQSKLQAMVTTRVGTSTVRALADLGVKTERDGSLSIDATILGKALGRDPAAANALFSTAATGLSAVAKSLVDVETRAGDGALTARQSGLGDTVKAMNDQADAMQRRIDAFRHNLAAEFTAMEGTVSGLKSIGNFLSAQQTTGKSS
jgi:flagellar hook-associated protein 2